MEFVLTFILAWVFAWVVIIACGWLAAVIVFGGEDLLFELSYKFKVWREKRRAAKVR